MNVNHRPSESSDLSLSIGMGSLIYIDKTMEGMNNEGSSKDNKKLLIKVNTKRHQLNGNLSQVNKSKTKRVINLKENNMLQNFKEIDFINRKSPKNKKSEYDNDMKKILLIQKWWKIIFDKNKKNLNSISHLVACFKKIYCLKIFELIRKQFPSIDYFFHKWNNKVTRLKIINHLLKKAKKTRNNKDKFDMNNKLVKKSTNKNNAEKSKDKNHKNTILKSKKKTNLILNNINIETTKSKECQTTKHNKKKNLINFTLSTNAYNNKKKPTPYSPIMISTTERHISPINILNKNVCSRKSPKSSNLDKSIPNTNKDSNKNKEKKSSKLNDINNGKNSQKKFGEKINKLIVSKNLDNNKQINNNNTSSKNENQFIFIENQRILQSSRINNYMLNIEKKDMNIREMYYNLNKKPKKGNKLNKNSNNNNKSLHFNTEVNSNKINSIFKMNKQDTKVYENCLYKDNKYQNYYSPINKELYNKISHKDNLVLFNKNVILINKEKGKLSSVKDLNHYKKNKFSYNTISETNSTLSKVSSIDNTSYKRIKKIKCKNINIYKYFYDWKEYAEKKNIIKKLNINYKFINYINYCTNNILLRKSMENLKRIYKKEKLYDYFKNMVIKLLINLMKRLAEYKSNYINEIKKANNDKYNNVCYYHKKGDGDIINNININNFINYADYKLFHKRKARSPNLITKIKESKTINNNSEFNCGTKLSLSNSSSKKIINSNKHKNPISINAFDYNDKDDDNIIDDENNYGNITNYNQKYNEYMNRKRSDHNYKKIDNEMPIIEDGVIVDQINQLKMVFNLLERHNSINNKFTKINTLSNCFNKWKIFSFNNQFYPHKINEKIINLKPFQNSKIIQGTIGNTFDISLKKKSKENKSSPKIINVINVQNYNENNNYNYNFNSLPMKDTSIYALNQRNSYDCYNIDKLNSDFDNLTYNDNNVINANVNNNFNLNATSFLILNDNKHANNQNVVYHKKRLDKTYINHNSNHSLVNDYNLNNFYKYNKGNYASSLYFIGHNKSQIILPDFDNKIYNLKKNTKINPAHSIFRDNSFKNIPSCLYQDPFPELKYGFEKKNHIEEKEINFFENTNNNNQNNQNIYIKKQSGESKKSKINSNNHKFVKTSVFSIDESDKNNNNLIKTLNIQFGNRNRQLENNANCLYNENNNFITINKDQGQDIKQKNKDKYSKTSLGTKYYKNIFDDKKIKNCHKYRTTNIIKNLNKMAYYNDTSVTEFDYKDPIQEKMNQTFVFYPKLIENFLKSQI